VILNLALPSSMQEPVPVAAGSAGGGVSVGGTTNITNNNNFNITGSKAEIMKEVEAGLDAVTGEGR
jgi:hypothetical protein